MTTTQVVGLGWKRGVEERYPGRMDASLEWGTYNHATNGVFLSGMVATVTPGTNEVAKADSTVNGGRFRGVMFTECGPQLDDTKAGSPPAVMVGGMGVILKIRKSALVASGVTYTAGAELIAGTGANVGRLVPAGASPARETVVGVVQKVETDGIEVLLHPATA